MNEKKVCSQCGKVYSSDTEICPSCNVILIECEAEPETPFETDDPNVTDKSAENYFSGLKVKDSLFTIKNRPNTWMYIVAILFPLAGILLSVAKVIRGEDTEGKYLMITSLVALAIWIAVCWGILSVQAEKAERLARATRSSYPYWLFD